MFWCLLAGLVVGAAVGGRVGWVLGLDANADALLRETQKVNKILNAIRALSGMGYAYWKAHPGTFMPEEQLRRASNEEREAVRVTEGFKEALIQADNVEEEIRRQAQRG